MLEKLQSLLVITNLYPVPWGVNRASFNKQQFDLISKHQQVNIIVLLTWNEWLNHRKSCENTSNLKYCPYFYIPKFGRPLVPFFQFISLLFMLPWIKKHKPTSLMASWGFPDSVAVSMLNSFLKLPFFVKVHGTDVNENIQFSARKKLMKKWLNRTNTIFCASKALAESLKNVGIKEEKLTVNYNGVNSKIFFPVKTKPQKQLLVFVGSLIATKGVNELLAAFILAKKQCIDLELDILGEGPMKTTMAELINKNKLSDSVRLQGSLPLNKVAEFVRNANALVLPSYREGVPNVLLESFASGTPVIATKVGGIPEVVNNSVGILVEAKSTSQLAQAIENLFKKTWKESDILHHASQFDWNKNVQNVLSRINAQ